MSNSELQVKEQIREMYVTAEQAPWPLTAEELRSLGRRRRRVLPDAKALVLIAAAIVVIVVGFLASRSPAPHRPTGVLSTTTTRPHSSLQSVTVPDLVGLSQATGAAVLAQGGLTVGAATVEPSMVMPAGTIVATVPAAGAHVATASAVNVWVSSGPPAAGAPATTTTTTTSIPPSPLRAAMTPRSGPLGSTTIEASATLTGIAPTLSGTIQFWIHLGTSPLGQPAYATSATFDGPGTYPMPSFVPTIAGTYYLQVVAADTTGSVTYQVAPYVDPALTTVISG